MTSPSSDGRPVDSDAAVSVRGLSMDYGDVPVLLGIDLDLRRGEVCALVGPNGAGKTTTVEILEGYRARTGGAVKVLGVDPGRPTRAWRARIGIVLQTCEMPADLTVWELVERFAGFYPHPRSVAETIELVGLSDSAASTWPWPWWARPSCSSSTSPPRASIRRPGIRPGR